MFPNLYPDKVETERKKEEQQSIDAAKLQHQSLMERIKDKPGLPGWLVK